MPELKKEIIPEPSKWFDFELEDKGLLDPPVLKLHIRPIDRFDAECASVLTGMQYRNTMRRLILDAVLDWDLKKDGKPLPLDNLNRLLGGKIKGEEISLGMKILEAATIEENFLKN